MAKQIEGVAFEQSTAKRIVNATRQVEEQNLPKAKSKPGRQSKDPPNIRAILLESLNAGGSAKAERTRFDRSRVWFEVCLLGYPTNPSETFRLILSWNGFGAVSGEIRLDATAAELATALNSFGLPGRISVGFGRRGDMVPGRWSIGIQGPFAAVIDGAALAELRILNALTGVAAVVVSRSSWRPTGEIIDVWEGGLIMQNSTFTPLRPGAAVHCAHHQGAGYVVNAAEARKFSSDYFTTSEYY